MTATDPADLLTTQGPTALAATLDAAGPMAHVMINERTNNLPENLRLCADRWEHAERSGLTVHGEKLPHWKPKAHKKGGHKARR